MLNEIHDKNDFFNHLKSRGLRPEMDIRVWIDWNEELVYFPIWSPVKLIGYQRYAWREEKIRSNKGKYYTWITDEWKSCGCWGLSRLNKPYDDHSQPVLVTEGIWDAIRCIQSGYDAVAILGATPSKQFIQWFRMAMMFRNTIGILDNDENNTGKALAKLCKSSIMCEWHKDIGDHSPREAKLWLNSKLK